MTAYTLRNSTTVLHGQSQTQMQRSRNSIQKPQKGQTSVSLLNQLFGRCSSVLRTPHHPDFLGQCPQHPPVRPGDLLGHVLAAQQVELVHLLGDVVHQHTLATPDVTLEGRHRSRHVLQPRGSKGVMFLIMKLNGNRLCSPGGKMKTPCYCTSPMLSRDGIGVSRRDELGCTSVLYTFKSWMVGDRGRSTGGKDG